MQLRIISKRDVDRAKAPSLFDFGNKVLYDLCNKFWRHTKEEQIIAKVSLIGRSYSAALERGRKLTDDGKDFYLATVGPAMKRANIDSWFKLIPPNAAPGCRESIEIHRKLQDLFRTMIDRNQRSLASKYLHFHFPKVFYLFDSRAAQAMVTIIPRDVRKAFNDTNDVKIDRIYNSFAKGCVWLGDHIHKQFGGRPLTPRELDRLLLAITDDERKSLSMKAKSEMKRSRFIGKASDFTIVKSRTTDKRGKK